MSTVTPLASGPINASDSISVELVTPSDAPATVLIRWPDAPSVVKPNPRAVAAVAAVAASVVKVLAEAQTRLREGRR